MKNESSLFKTIISQTRLKLFPKSENVEVFDMRMSFVLPEWILRYPPGGFNVVFQLASRLAKEGHQVTLVHMNDRYKYLYDSFFDKRFLHREFRSWRTHTRLRSNSLTRKSIAAFYRLTQKIDYDYSILMNVRSQGTYQSTSIPVSDLIFATSWETAFIVYDYVRQMNSRPQAYYLIQNSEDDPSYSGELNQYARMSYSFPLRKIVINQKLLRRFKDDDPFLMNVGIDTKYYRVLNDIQKRNSMSIFIQLRSGEAKGSSIGLEAVGRLHELRPEIQFHAFGDISLSEIPSYISYLRFPTRLELRNLYNQCAIFVLPSLVEGFSLTTLEAMSCGACVVATNCGGTTDYIESTENGILVRSNDSNAIVNAVLNLVDHSDLRIEMARRGTAVSQKYSYDSMYESFKGIITR